MKSRISLLLAAMLLAGCVSPQEEARRAELYQRAAPEAIRAALRPGVTTKAQVRAWLGEPLHRAASLNGMESWVYSFGTAQWTGGPWDKHVESQARAVTVLFQGELVVNAAVSESPWLRRY